MDIAFFVSPRKLRETKLGERFKIGAAVHGDRVELITTSVRPDVDVACLIGIKDLKLMNWYRALGVPVLYFDKPYDRRSSYWRVAINGNHPTRYIMTLSCSNNRREMFGWHPAPWRYAGKHVLFAGSSDKFHTMTRFMSATEDATQIVKQIRQHGANRVIYRPKPSDKSAVPVDGAKFDRSKFIADSLRDASCLVTRSSNACFEALMAGVPSIVLGDAVLKPISSTSIDDVNSPRLASDAEKTTLLNDLAYCQWKPEEILSGEAWEWMRGRLTL